MARRVTPMLHVPDVDATADWYASIGFQVRDRGSDGAETVFAALGFGDSEIMLNVGGKASEAWRREVDLYVQVDDVDALFAEIGERVEIVEPLHDTFYGMREFIIRDCNRLWITFGTPVAGP
jgi:uncharacterized glyoxalase superfamily protein PhnB